MEQLSDRVTMETLWPFSSLYKSHTSHVLSQQQRRVAYLQKQKEKRHEQADNNRKQCELFIKHLESFVDYEEMQCESDTTSKNKPPKLKLMLSEWLTEIPDDLEENWLVKFAPEGFRILLISRKHVTICYNKHGRIVLKMKTHFPGGGFSDNNGLTVLDCIFNKRMKTIFVLDCLFWNSMSTLDSEANFRFFWLKSKFDDHPELLCSKKYKFVLMNFMPAQRPLIQDVMFTSFQIDDKTILYDGIVFYHKESHYSFGYTPLVAWLSSFMLPEKLSIDFPVEYSLKKPVGYICQQHYLAELNAKRKNRSTTEDNSEENSLSMELT